MSNMEQFITRIRTNLNGVLEMTQMFDGLMMTGDNLANRIIVELNRDGVPVSIGNENDITGYLIRGDGYTLDIPGGILVENGYGHAYIDIPDLAYVVSGPLSIAIRMSYNGQKSVIATATCYVNMTRTDAIIDTAHRIPDVQEVIAFLDELDQRKDTMDANEEERQSTFETTISSIEASETAINAAEAARVTAETARVTAESNRASAETARVTAESNRASAETARVTAESNRASAETARETAQQQRNAKIDGMTIEAVGLDAYASPTATITEVNGHKHITLGIAPGDPFVIQKTFASVSAMNAYSGTDIRVGQFVLISSNVEDPDNAKMYVKTANGYSYITDLSGAQGIQGPRGYSISSVSMNQNDYTLTVTMTDGTSYTTPSIRGATGVSITGFSMDSNYKLHVTFSDGSTYETPTSIRGATGNGIASTSMNSSTHALTITMTDGTSYTTPSLLGDTGNGIASVSMDSTNYTLTLTMTDGTSYTTPSLKGDPGTGSNNLSYNSTDNSLTVTFT